MGIADIIPGISGGTIAFILGIYEELIDAIKSFNLQFLRLFFRGKLKKAFNVLQWQFIIAILAGIITSVLILANIISWLLSNHPVNVYAFFFGLILATVIIIARVIRRWDTAKILLIVISGVVTFVFVGLTPVTTPTQLWFIFICGAIAISAMIMPGISGAFLLLLLGKYQFILDAVNQRDYLVLSVFILGIIVGVITFVRLLSWLFHNYHDGTIAVLTGFVIGSLNKIWPWKKTIDVLVTSKGKVIPLEHINMWPEHFSTELFFALVLMLMGLIVALLLSWLQKGIKISSNVSQNS